MSERQERCQLREVWEEVEVEVKPRTTAPGCDGARLKLQKGAVRGFRQIRMGGAPGTQ